MTFRTCLVLLVLSSACGDDDEMGLDASADAAVDGSVDGSVDGPLDSAVDVPDCPPGQVLRFGDCVRNPASCAGGEECQNDSCCVAGECIPFGLGPCGDFDEECEATATPGVFAPELECEWTTVVDTSNGTGGDNQVMSTPLVADFDLDDDPTTLHPSVVFTSVSAGQSLRLIDGATCEELGAITHYENLRDPAIGDLDGDGRPEIVVRASIEGVFSFAAFRWNLVDAAFEEMWQARDPAGLLLPGGIAAIHDLDGDGASEVLAGSLVLDGATGVRRIAAAPGTHFVFADIDADGTIELVTSTGIFEPDFVAGIWVPEPTFVRPAGSGSLAVADFGDFGDGPGVGEIVVAGGGSLHVMRITGEYLFGPVPLPGGARGGAPVVADFDGDGVPEVGVADSVAYAVFDLECDADPVPADCESRGIRWSQPSQDLSSGFTGSSVFDFEGDGAAEAVYADECFLRVYDGATGRVKFSTARSSNTLGEYPVIADTDGDFNSEVVVGSNTIAYSRNCPDAFDPLFEGPACSGAEPCASSLHECTDGTCRARKRGMVGVQIYGDRTDLWVNSRPIWNQFHYHVTHVNDDGTIPATGDWQINWSLPGLNNFRQNVQGIAGNVPAPDMTIRPLSGWACDGSAEQIFEVQVCNRGTEPVAPGVPVTFYAMGESICEGSNTAAILTPGACEDVLCTWTSAPSEPVDVVVIADDEAAGSDPYTECREGNNTAVFPENSCDLI